MSAGDWAAARGSGATGVSCRAAYVFNGINGIYDCNVIYGLYDSKGISRRAVMRRRGCSSCAVSPQVGARSMNHRQPDHGEHFVFFRGLECIAVQEEEHVGRVWADS